MDTALELPFNFDDWAELAQRDAEAFERRRQEAIEALIAEAPEHLRARLHRLQWRIDAERHRYKHPLKSCVVIFNMMWDSVYGDHGLLRALNALNDPDARLDRQAAAASARVLPFHAQGK